MPGRHQARSILPEDSILHHAGTAGVSAAAHVAAAAPQGVYAPSLHLERIAIGRLASLHVAIAAVAASIVAAESAIIALLLLLLLAALHIKGQPSQRCNL